MKILILHNRYQSTNIGGEDIVFENEIVQLRLKLGFDNVFSYEVSNDHISKFKLIFSIWFSFYHYRVIKKLIKKESIDLVHIHNFYPLLTPSIFKAAKKCGIKVVHTLHNYRLWCISGLLYREGKGVCESCINKSFPFSGIQNRCYRGSYLQSTIAQASFAFYKSMRFFSFIDYYFVLSDFQFNKLLELGVPKGKIILKSNGLSISERPSINRSGYIFVGRLEPSKGIISLLDAWMGLAEGFVLTIIGTGELESSLMKKYSKLNIHFMGKCSREKTLDLIAEHKYLLQTSLLYETFGLTIIEAMSLGVPVIGYNIGTRSDFIKDAKNGFLCEQGELKSTIVKSYEYSNYSELSFNAKNDSKKFSNDKVTTEQIEIYKKILLNEIV